MNRFLMSLILYLSASLASATDFTATLDRTQTHELGTLVSGAIADVSVTKGDRVKKGDLLVRLDDREFKARLASANATYVKTKALYDEAKREEERALELYDRTLLSEHELQIAQIERIKAEAVKGQARAEKVRAELALEQTVIEAPYDGLITNVHVVVEQMVSNRVLIVPLVTLAPTNQMRALARVEDKQLINIRMGAEVLVVVGGDWINGKITDISPEKSGNGILIEAVFPTSGKNIKPGQASVIRVKNG